MNERDRDDLTEARTAFMLVLAISSGAMGTAVTLDEDARDALIEKAIDDFQAAVWDAAVRAGREEQDSDSRD